MAAEKTVTLEKVYKKLDSLEKLVKNLGKKELGKKRAKSDFFLKAAESSTVFWDNKKDEIWNDL